MAIYKKHQCGVSCCLDNNDLYKITQDSEKGLFCDISDSPKYACVYLLDGKSKCAFVYGCHGDFCHSFKQDLLGSSVHKTAHDKAFEGNKVIYEWFFGEEKTAFYQTTLIPLHDASGETQSVLGFVTALDESRAFINKDFAVADDADRGFVRLMINAREEEKRQISRALHDEIGTAAVMINSLLGILKEDIKEGKQSAALENIRNVEEAVEGSLSRIKKVIINLRPPQITEVGLNSAVKELLDNIEGTVPLVFEYNYNVSEGAKMSENVKITLYRIVQESLSNAVKHAKAKNFKVSFTEDDSDIFLTVQDDGVGYPKGGHKGVNKLGIRGMRESITNLGGTISIEGIKGKGTTISVICPKISYARKI